MSADIKLSKAKLSKISQSVGLIGALLSIIAGLLMKVAPLGVAAAALAIDKAIQNKRHDSGITTLFQKILMYY